MSIKLDVRINPLALAADQDLVDELNRRNVLVKWARKSPAKPSNLGRSFISPSCKIENWDCTTNPPTIEKV